jgi:D-alanyl-lipoteichoic acid acyltransferase DltB (MBOAT superfamily)
VNNVFVKIVASYPILAFYGYLYFHVFRGVPIVELSVPALILFLVHSVFMFLLLKAQKYNYGVRTAKSAMALLAAILAYFMAVLLVVLYFIWDLKFVSLDRALHQATVLAVMLLLIGGGFLAYLKEFRTDSGPTENK